MGDPAPSGPPSEWAAGAGEGIESAAHPGVDALQRGEGAVRIAVGAGELVREELVSELEEGRLGVEIGVDVFLGDREMIAVLVDLGGGEELFEALALLDLVGLGELAIELRRGGRRAVRPGDRGKSRWGVAAGGEGAREQEHGGEAGGKAGRHWSKP